MQETEKKDYIHETKRWGLLLLVVTCIVIVIAMVTTVIFGVIGRWQDRQEAQNRVTISQTEIQNQAQRVEIAKQQAEVRVQDAIGVREAQDEIAKTLTPLYVQFEMVDALRQIAQSGRNNSVVYIPAGANGIPLVSNVTEGQVGQPDQDGGN